MNPTFPSEVFSVVAANSWRASWLIAALLLLRFAVRGRIPAQVWFFVWLVVALRLLVPVSVSTPWSPYNLGLVVGRAPALPAAPRVAGESPAVGLPAALTTSATPFAAEPLAPEPPPAAATWRWREAAAVGWIAGVVVLVVARLAAGRRFRARLRQAWPADARVRALAAAEHPGVICLETELVAAPALFGFRQPRLLLPPGLAARLSDEELRLVVRHELGHWFRRDLLAQRVLQAAVTLHWFNPLVWIAARLARVDCEHACDEFVLRRENAGGSGGYGAALLKVLALVRETRRSAAVIGILESRQQLEERVRRIASYRTATAGRVGSGIALVLVLAGVSVTRESRAQRPAVSPATTAPDETLANDSARRQTKASPAVVDHFQGAMAPQQRKVDEAEKALREFRERTSQFSVDQRAQMVAEVMKSAHLELQRRAAAVQSAEIRLKQIGEVRAAGGDLVSLPFIAEQPMVGTLRQQLAQKRIERVRLWERYRERHPMMIESQASIAAIERELQQAVDSVCQRVEAEHQAALREREQWQAELERLKRESLTLDRESGEYQRLRRQFETENQILQSMAQRARDEAMTVRPAETSGQPPREPDDAFQVSVVGAVNAQSAVTLSGRDQPIVLDAIARAGGFAANANRAAVRLIRAKPDGTRETITLSESVVMHGTDPAARVQRGDVIVVPEAVAAAPRFVQITGAVNRPGRIELPADRRSTLVEVLATAGGATRLADLKKVVVTRVDPKTGQKKAGAINLDPFLRGTAGPDANWAELTLEPDDSIFIPERIL